MAKQSIKCQEQIIMNYNKAYKYVTGAVSYKAGKTALTLEYLKHDRERLQEKLKQLNILNELYDKNAPKEVVEEILIDIEEAKDSDNIESHIVNLDLLKEKHDELTRQIQSLNMQYS
eukprot:TRINITY_DN3372_c0_g5_i1.p1 TRINITY_DN3372_c0_g5~~TRINITY_DN3372_c0_g5_i1.p1  ORF type:complete len:117 (+),score=27.73 TRINITY_DN3372_c0_g5_i1:402-752(+)